MDDKTIAALAKEFGFSRRLVAEITKPKILGVGANDLAMHVATARQVLTAFRRVMKSLPFVRYMLAPLTKAARAKLLATAGLSKPETWLYTRFYNHFSRLRDVSLPPITGSARRLPMRVVFVELGIYMGIKKPSPYLRKRAKQVRRRAFLAATAEYETLFPPSPVTKPRQTPAPSAPVPVTSGARSGEYRHIAGSPPR